MDRDEIIADLRQLIADESGIDDMSIIERETNLFEAGLLDSLFAVSLVAFCEDRFGCEIEMAELTEENFGSILAIADMVSEKTAAAG